MKIPFLSDILTKVQEQNKKLDDLLLATQAFRLLMESIIAVDAHQQDLQASVDKLTALVQKLDQRTENLDRITVDISKLEQKVVNSAQYEKIENELTANGRDSGIQPIPEDFTLPLSSNMKIRIEGQPGETPVRIIPYQVGDGRK